MAVLATLFVDTSVFVAGLIELGETSTASRTLLEAIATKRLTGVQTAWHCCLEFYSVATRLPAGLRVSPDLAHRMVTENIIERMAVSDLPPSARATFFSTLVGEHVSGGRVYDAHIAEVARTAGARTVVTGNRRHFNSLTQHGIRVLTPDQFVEERGL
ncbi:MAG: PIN domain-containing protein [Acidobacteria bacterium]|nr:PIN domain-containing protein [Acidobacteriota bacterium]